ncbi:MAG: HNH endonuclease signature motif containing protein, partial [Candidatus Dormiibacterota bacterium]
TKLRRLRFAGAPVEAPTLDMTGEPVPIEMVRRIFCDCQLTPLALGQDGNVVGVGRSKRTFTAAQRKAIARRDGGCAFPGCGRDPSWCDGHHLVPWYLGGSTEVDNGSLLCRGHHVRVHDEHWTLVRDLVTGTFDAIPP